MMVQPGGVSSRVRWLIGSTCAVTVVLAAYGMQALWDCIEWVQRSWGVANPEGGAFWYRHGVALAISVAIALAWLPRFRISRLLRVAVVLPILHLGAIIAVARVWSVFDGNGLANLDQLRWTPEFMAYVQVAMPSVCTIVLAFAVLVIVAIAIKRRRDEWAHAMVMVALSYLLTLGLWLPFVARLAVHEVNRSHGPWYTVRGLSAEAVAWLATVPAATVALVVTVIAFRAPRAFAAWRHVVRPVTFALFGLSALVALTLPNKSWLVYLESSYLVMLAVVLAVVSLVLLAAVTWLRSFFSRRVPRGFTRVSGVIAADERSDIAGYEVTSWLRGPLLFSRPFVVTTVRGNVPVHGARLVVPVPASSTPLEVGGWVGVLGPGARVDLAVRGAEGDGHPFRTSDAADVALVTAPDAGVLRFSDVVLVVWRPAVAYLAILVAVATPYLTIFLT